MIYEFINFILTDIIRVGIDSLNYYATLILVIVTIIYARSTHKMEKLMATQVIADIQVSNIVLESAFIKNQFKKKIEEQPYFNFNLLFDVRNKNAGSGSIDKPILLLKFKNNNSECSILPTTKEFWDERLEESSSMVVCRMIENDLGGTIFLRGGESKKEELKYRIYNSGDDLSKHIKDYSVIEYYLKFSDNLGKNYVIKINDIKGEEEVKRY